MSRHLPSLALGLLALAASTAALRGATIPIPNGSFETPLAPREQPYAMPDMAAWQKSLQPFWYDPAQNFNTPWETLMGTFFNAPISTYIDNCDGAQAAFFFALPEIALFQDYDSLDGTNTTPSHAFDARFNVNNAYRLTIGVIGGVYGYPPLYQGATLELSLYYRDASGNKVTVASTTVTNSAQLFPTNTHFVDFSVYVPGVWATNDWAGQHIGVQIASTVGFELMGGYWDVDNARLTETPLPALSDLRMTDGHFGFTLESRPGLRFEILAATNPAVALSIWTNLGNVTNTTGAIPFLDPATSVDRRFYRANQLP
jgi:hypothetical protein